MGPKNYRYLAVAALLVSIPAVRADVSLTFNNTQPPATVAGDLTFDFTVDGAGGVTLDASTTSTNPTVIAAVDAWDGAAGTISYTSAYSSSFSIGITATQPMRLTSQGGAGGGLGVQGQNQNRLDRPGIEEIYATPAFSISGAALDIKNVSWSDRTTAPEFAVMQLDYADQTLLNQLVNVPDSHREFLEATIPYYETDTHIFVHATLDPKVPLSEQTDHTLYGARFKDPPPHMSGKIMVCGHTSQPSGAPRNTGHAICIETCPYKEDGWLTCLYACPEPGRRAGTARYWQANQKGECRERC